MRLDWINSAYRTDSSLAEGRGEKAGPSRPADPGRRMQLRRKRAGSGFAAGRPGAPAPGFPGAAPAPLRYWLFPAENALAGAIGWGRMICAFAVVLAATLLIIPLQFFLLKLWPSAVGVAPPLWHRLACRMLGLRVHIAGEMAAARPLMIVANHVSWADIMAVGSTGRVFFIAKGDMRGWPVIGKLAALQRTIFVDRSKRQKAGSQAGEIGRRMASGDPMVLFAEGSTSDGNVMLPFKSSLFEAARMAAAAAPDGTVLIQPLALAYTRRQGMAMGRQHRPAVAWIGDQYLAPHAFALLREGALDVELIYGDPAPFRVDDGRKAAAQDVEAAVRAMVAQTLRDPPKRR